VQTDPPIRLRIVVNVNGDNSALAAEIEHLTEKQGTASRVGSGLDNQVRLNIVDDLLIDPQIQGALGAGNPHPSRALENPRVAIASVVVDVVEAVDNEILVGPGEKA
jgi:hypothetical protein